MNFHRFLDHNTSILKLQGHVEISERFERYLKTHVGLSLAWSLIIKGANQGLQRVLQKLRVFRQAPTETLNISPE
jgi:hypothetical protein